MLSIGKLGPRSAEYYLEHVARGVEDYYLHAGEAPGRWLGAGAVTLGLRGEVADDDLRAILGGLDPLHGVALSAARAGHERLPGFDLTLRAPKSVSLLFALGEGGVSREVKVAHEEAVVAAVQYLERQAAFSRRRIDGHIVPVRGQGFVAAAFQHRTSRAGDPLLHHHVLVANVIRDDGGRWGALDGRLVYWHAKTAGYLYQAELRAQLTRRLGVGWTPVRRGTAEVDGIPREVIQAFSRRRQQITERMAERGETSARAAQAATLDTRRAKDYTISPDGLLPEWRARAQALGLGQRELDAVVHPGQRVRRGVAAFEVADAVAALIAPTGLTAQASTFDRRDVVRALCEHLGPEANAATIERVAEEVLSARDIVCFGPIQSSPMPDSGVATPSLPAPPVVPDERRFTTRELLATERAVVDGCLERNTRAQRLLADARARSLSLVLNPGWAAGSAPVDARHLEAALRRRPSLSEEQRAMVHRLTVGEDAVVVVRGHAGTGKTYALDACREVWQASGYAVVGCALSAQAARELQAGAGITSTTIDRLLLDLVNHRDEVLPRTQSVLVVDEAGMAGTRLLERLLAKAQLAEAKVVLVGDDRQLPEIAAGGAFHGLCQRLGPVELAENRRQEAEWERQALALLRDGRTDEAMAAYCEHGRVVIGPSADAVRARLVADWWAAERDKGGGGVMVALRRDDVDELNARARAVRVATGEVTGPELELPTGCFGVGDRVVTTRNARALGVVNGTRATIINVDRSNRSLTVERHDGDGRPGGSPVTLPADYLEEGHLRHAYAVTGHKAQGMTASRAFVLGDDTVYREWGYVALSRGRTENRLYVVAPDPELVDDPSHGRRPERPDGAALRDLRDALHRSRAQLLALDQLSAECGPPATDVSELKRAARQLEDGELRRAAVAADEVLRLPRPARSEPRVGSAERGRLEKERDRLVASRESAVASAEQCRQRLAATDGVLGRRLHRPERTGWQWRLTAETRQLDRVDRDLAHCEARLGRLDADENRMRAWRQTQADAAPWGRALETETELRVGRRVAAGMAAPAAAGHPAAPTALSERAVWRQALQDRERRSLRGVDEPGGRQVTPAPAPARDPMDACAFEPAEWPVAVGDTISAFDAGELLAEEHRAHRRVERGYIGHRWGSDLEHYDVYDHVHHSIDVDGPSMSM